MKKTMFITSVIMVVVLAIALTTSSLAWFSAGGATTVTAQNLKLSALEATSVSGLELATVNSEAQFSTNALELPAISDRVMIPTCPVNAISDNAAVADMELWQALQLPGAGTTGMFQSKVAKIGNSTVFNEAPSALTSNQRYLGTIYIRNSGGAACGATCDIIFPGDSGYAEVTSGDGQNINHARTGLVDPQIWVAVFAITRSDAEGNPVSDVQLLALESYKGADNSNAVAMTFAEATSELGIGEAPGAVNRQALNTFAHPSSTLHLDGGSDSGTSFVAPEATELQIYAWFDGSTIDGYNNDAWYKIKIEFNKVADPDANP